MINYCIDLHFELEQDGPTATDQYGNRGFHLAWTTGGGAATCPPVSGSTCQCTANRCVVNAETGALDFQKGSMSCIGSSTWYADRLRVVEQVVHDRAAEVTTPLITSASNFVTFGWSSQVIAIHFDSSPALGGPLASSR
jgi:hypothetical protein